MHRFFTEQQNIKDDILYIYDDSSHISRSFRMKIGDEIIVFDGTGSEYVCSILSIEKNVCIAEIKAKVSSSFEPDCKVTIFQGLPKTGKMETIIQKAVELGAYKIVPVEMERCVVRLNEKKKQEERLRRWNKVSLEAAKQCGRGIVPSVTAPINFTKALDAATKLDLAVMPYEVMGHNGDKSFKKILNLDFKTIGFIIGPEGGFSDSEAENAKISGVKLVGLGKRILRTETVASTLVSILMYEKNEI